MFFMQNENGDNIPASSFFHSGDGNIYNTGGGGDATDG